MTLPNRHEVDGVTREFARTHLDRPRVVDVRCGVARDGGHDCLLMSRSGLDRHLLRCQIQR